MTTYETKDYLNLLRISYDYLLECHKEYENSALESKKMKYSQHYHIFSFAMILFSIKDRLKTDFPNDEQKIFQYFELGKNFPKKFTPAGIVHELANEWKHEEGFQIRQRFGSPYKLENGVITLMEVQMHLPVKHSLNSSDTALIQLFKQALEDTESFCKTNKFV